MDYQSIARRAKLARTSIALASSNLKNAALLKIRDAIHASRGLILESNQKDMDAARHVGLNGALLDRLELNTTRVDGLIEGLNQSIALADPVGQVSQMSRRPSGIQVGLMRQPIGVIGIIFESRPNVTIDAAALCLKSGNACVLRGGSEAFHSNQAIAACITAGLCASGMPEDCVQVAPTADREFVNAMISDKYSMCDVIIPRGGKRLIKKVSKDARVPIIKHLDGNCHVYVDMECELDQALSILENAKTHRYGVCNAAESFLIHQAVAQLVLPKLAEILIRHGVEIRGCGVVTSILTSVSLATEDDWFEEYLAPIIAIKVVSDVGQAIDHINTYGSHHTDAIISTNQTTIQRFMSEVDSSSVISNASTRCADGFEYGLGAEIGVSTDRIHVRGPVGLEGLTNQKWIVFGEGQVRS